MFRTEACPLSKVQYAAERPLPGGRLIRMYSLIAAKRTRRLAHDLFAVIACWLLAHWLRFNFDVPEIFISGPCARWCWWCAFTPCVLVSRSVPGIWRYASLMDLRRIILAVGFASMLVAAAVYMLALPTCHGPCWCCTLVAGTDDGRQPLCLSGLA